MIDDLTPEARDQLEKFNALPIEEKLFPEINFHPKEIPGLGLAVCPGIVEVTAAGLDADGDPIEVVGNPLGVIRRDTGDFRLCIRFKIKRPIHFAGRIGEMWHRGDEPGDLSFFRIVCDHVWEELDDGSSICFECDERKEGDA